MKKNIKVIYGLEIVLLLINLIFYSLTKVIPSGYNIYLVITFLLMAVILLRIHFGKTDNKSYYFGYTYRTIVMVLMFIGLSIYLLGVILGFTYGYGYGFNIFFESLLPLVIVLILFEYLRFIVIKHNFTNFKSSIVFTILLSLLEIFIYYKISALDTSYHVFIFICLTVLPIIAEQFLCSYLTYKVGFGPSVLFKLSIYMYLYLLPIVPKLGDYLFSFVKILTPFIIFYVINRAMVEEDRNKKIITKNTLGLFSIPIIVFLVFLVILVSGVFNTRMIAIASNSMAPLYYRGDAVIYNKVSLKELKKGDILVFKNSDMIITHRIVKISRKNDAYYFTTKGDANDSVDSVITIEDNVIGRVDYVIKYIGYPTIMLNELFERR